MPLHIPVMVEEVLSGLNIKPGSVIVDGTFGLGGHTKAILESTDAIVVGIDRSHESIAYGQSLVKQYPKRLFLKQGSFADLPEILETLSIKKIDGILLDLGLSTWQLQESKQGFSFQTSEPLDMRFDTEGMMTAADIVNTWEKEKLADIFVRYGEETLSKPIANEIVKQREEHPIQTTDALVDIIVRVYNRFYPPYTRKKHPATKVFQALRIAVNSELTHVETFLDEVISKLPSQVTIAIITFHSLEDRLVKQAFQLGEKGCICPPELPVCRCDKKAILKRINKKPIIPTDQEMNLNAASRSAKLRLAITL